jgi:hypothetical protein
MDNKPEMSDGITQSYRRKETYVKKYAIPCTIMTTAGLLEGELHKRGNQRIIDEMNTANAFIAVTNAKFQLGEPTLILESNFLILRGDQIVWVRPIPPEEITE